MPMKNKSWHLKRMAKKLPFLLMKGTILPKKIRNTESFSLMMRSMTAMYALRKRRYPLKTGRFVNMENFIESIREETASIVP